MYQKLKDALNNSLTWLLFLVGCVLLLWKKEKSLEFELEQEKVNETIKDDTKAVAQADSAANASTGSYEQLRSEYIKQHPEDPVQ